MKNRSNFFLGQEYIQSKYYSKNQFLIRHGLLILKHFLISIKVILKNTLVILDKTCIILTKVVWGGHISIII